MSCHAPAFNATARASYTVALVGNPNVGKSAVFNRLTGLSEVTANYPGKTVELASGIMTYARERYLIVDLPGTYGLDTVSEDQIIAKQAILHGNFDILVVVVDASNLRRNLYQVLQLLEIGKPVVLALNMIDCALRKGTRIDTKKMEAMLGVPVVPTVASTGAGLRKLVQTISASVHDGKYSPNHLPTKDDEYAGAALALTEVLVRSRVIQAQGLSAHGIATRLLENDQEVESMLSTVQDGPRIIEIASALRDAIELREGKPAGVVFAATRHALAEKIVGEATLPHDAKAEAKELALHYSIWLPTAIPLMFATVIGAFAFMFYAGGLIGDWLATSWATFVSPLLQSLTMMVFRNELASRVFLWGVDAGVLAALSVGVPYVLLFYVILSVLEDTGYLTNISFISHSLMRKLGLHGRSVIPLIMGLGCNVPAIMATRVLGTRRERMLASALITLTPCSARIAVVLGVVAYLIGWQYALAIFLVDLLIIGLIGKALNLILPGEPSPLMMEMAPFRIPSWNSVLRKTWFRFKGFMLMALPLVTVGSLIMGLLYELGFFAIMTEYAGPAIYSVLGLPAVAGVALVLGILRKELSVQLLIAMAVMQYGPSAHNLLFFMSPVQLLVFALVVTIYFPCIATMGVLGKEIGWRNTFAVMGTTIAVALFVGAVVFRLAVLIQ